MGKNEFKDEVGLPQKGLLSEVWEYLRVNKKWWLIPIIIVFILFGVLILIGSSGAGPFIYTLF
tara:strand:- start:114 stop:302 length:189 start_codon:yes stop_codon:yes gene_type:complete